MPVFKKILTLGKFLLLNISIFSQSFSISDGSISTCSGSLFDTGGQGASGYSNNENFTLTICPGTPTDVVTLVFNSFNLNTTNTAATGNNQDNLTIYDGDDTNAPTLGTYTGSQLQGVIVTCTSLNTSGCITLVFESNDSGTGVFMATISCDTPCQRPFAVASSMPDTIAKICKGDSVFFDGSASYAASNFTIVDYIWDFGDGTIDSVSGSTVSHVFNNDGAYVVQLYVIDDNGCINSNLVDQSVWVAPDPTFDPMNLEQLICAGETATQVAFPTQYPNTWTAIPDGNLGGPQYVPDQVGQCFSTSLNFQSFSPGQQLTNINDLLDICIEFEHSYMGDLVISIECPSGQNVILHQQGGGGTNLGDPDQQDGANFPGVGWTYCWSPTATNGTWASNGGWGGNTMTNSSNSNSLIPGTYESVNPLSDLVGCDLNGLWEIEFCDLWGSDDGFVTSWEINFDPSLFPPATSFTPIIGAQADSSFWTGPNIVNTSGDGNTIDVHPPLPGNYDYTYTVMDNHGCVNDTIITVVVQDNPIANAGGDTVLCIGSQYELQGGVSALGASGTGVNLFYSWTPSANLSNANVSNPNLIVGAPEEYVLTVHPQGHPLCFTTDTVSLSILTTFTDTTVYYCQSDPQVDLFNLIPGSTPSIGSWFDPGFAPTSNFFDPSNTSSGNYYFITNGAGCIDTAVVDIVVADPFVVTITQDTTICEGGVASIMVSAQGGFGAPYIENWSQSLVGNGPHLVSPIANTCYDVFITDSLGCNSPPETVCVNINPPLIISVLGNDTICSGSSATLLASTIGGNGGPFTYEWYTSSNLISSTDSVLVSPTQFTSYSIVVSQIGLGCTDSTNFDLTIADSIVIVTYSDTVICENGVATVSVSASGGLGGGYTEYWSDGLVGNGPHNLSPTSAECYNVYVEDAFGCVSEMDSVCVDYYQPLSSIVSINDTICPGDSTTLDVIVQGGIGVPYNLSWSAGGNVIGTTDSINVYPLFDTEYCVTISDNCETTPVSECTSVILFEEPTVVFESDIQEGCYPVTVTFFNETDSSMVGTTFWDFGDGQVSTQSSPVQNTFNTPGCYDITLSVTSPNGCSSSLVLPSYICAHDYPVADFGMSPNPTNIYETNIQFTDFSSSDVTNWNWDFGSESFPPNSTLNNPMSIFPGGIPGQYPVVLTVENQNECSSSVEYILIINELMNIFVPNSFTPDGDGINDVFYPVISTENVEDFSFLIFDRDGHIVFESDNQNSTWNGRFSNGESIPTSTFVWKLSLKDEQTNKKMEYYGHVNLIR